MNTITHKGETYEFATVEDLLETPRMRAARADPDTLRIAYDGFTILAAERLGCAVVFCTVGIVRDRVVLPDPLPKLTS